MRVRQVVSSVIATARQAGVVAEVRQQGPNSAGVSSLEIVPGAPEAAPIIVAWDEADDLAWVTIGAATTLEIPAEGGRYTDLSSADELQEVLKAVIEGRLAERLWLNKRGDVVAAEAQLHLPEKTIHLKTTGLSWRRWRRSTILREYPSYYLRDNQPPGPPDLRR